MKSKSSLLLVLATFLISSLANSTQQPLHAQDKAASSDEAKRLAKSLLSEWWKGGVKVRRQAKTAYDQFQDSNWSDDVAWAYVLNRLEYNQFRDADAAIKKMSERSKDWDYWYARTWLAVMSNDVDESLLLMQRTKQMAASEKAMDDTTKFKLYTRLGRLLGYVEGPLNSVATPATLQETIAIVTDGLDDVAFTHLQDQRKAVTQKYASLVNEKSVTVAQQVADKQQEAITMKAQLDLENQQIDDRANVLNTEMSGLNEESNRVISELQGRLAPIQRNLNSLSRSIGNVQSDLSYQYSEIAILEHAAAHEPDPYRRNRLLNRAWSYRTTARSLESELFNLQSNYNSEVGEMDIITGEIDSANQYYGGQLSIRQQELRQITAQRKRNLRKARKLNNPKAEVGYVNSMTSRTNHLPTYDPFPASALRQQWLRDNP